MEEKDIIKLYKSLCKEIELIAEKCNQCYYGGEHRNKRTQCNRQTSDCFSLIPAIANKSLACVSDANHPLISFYKTFAAKMRKNSIKVWMILKCIKKRISINKFNF